MSNDRINLTDIIQKQLEDLEKFKSNHDFWDNRLFVACSRGELTLSDWRYIFSQYYNYTKDFTRYLAAVMANCENDYYRSCLAENLWEEGGGADPDKRHGQVFRGFLQGPLGIQDIGNIEYQDSSLLFAKEYLSRCSNLGSLYGSAFLSMGTEGIVPQMYTIMIEGMRKAGIEDEELSFFKLHVECDDGHAETLAEMMASYSNQPGWYETCLTAIDDALRLRMNFFNALYEQLWTYKLKPIVADIRGDGEKLTHINRQEAGRVIKNDIGINRGLAQVLEHHLVTVLSGMVDRHQNSRHETLIVILQGKARVEVNSDNYQLVKNDTFLVPRGYVFQITATAKQDLVYLHVSDGKLTQLLVSSPLQMNGQGSPLGEKKDNFPSTSDAHGKAEDIKFIA